MTSALRRFSVCCLLPAVTLLAAGVSAAELTLELASERSSYRQGETLVFHLSYGWEGERPVYFDRPSSYGPEGLNLVARKGGCEYAIRPLHFDRPVEELLTLLTSLFPGDRLSVGTIELNFLDGLGEFVLPIPRPGTYSVTATFHSVGPTEVAGRRPIWRGSVSSEAISITILSPEPAEVERWLARLSTCAEAPCTDELAIEYFTFVRDPAAPGLLRRILERDVHQYRAAAALFHQGRAADAGFLERLGGTYYRELAEQLQREAGSPCF